MLLVEGIHIYRYIYSYISVLLLFSLLLLFFFSIKLLRMNNGYRSYLIRRRKNKNKMTPWYIIFFVISMFYICRFIVYEKKNEKQRRLENFIRVRKEQLNTATFFIIFVKTAVRCGISCVAFGSTWNLKVGALLTYRGCTAWKYESRSATSTLLVFLEYVTGYREKINQTRTRKTEK